MSRAEIIAHLLEHYPEYVDPLNGPAGIRGTGESLSIMPVTYTRSVRALEVLLVDMRRVRSSYEWEGKSWPVKALRWHVVRYFMVPRVQKQAYQAVTRTGTRPLLDDRGWPRKPRSGERILLNGIGPALCPVLCYARSPAARKDLAWAGCTYLGERFPFEPEIPPAALAA